MAGEDAGLHEFHPNSLIVSKDNTQQRLIGMNIFHWEHYWEGFVGYSITMDKRFLKYICCNPFIQLELYNVEHLSSHPASFLHSPVLFLVVTMSLLVFQPILPCKIYVLVGQSARKICKFVVGSCHDVYVLC